MAPKARSLAAEVDHLAAMRAADPDMFCLKRNSCLFMLAHTYSRCHIHGIAEQRTHCIVLSKVSAALGKALQFCGTHLHFRTHECLNTKIDRHTERH